MTEPEDRAESFLEKSSSVRMSHIEDIGEIGEIGSLEGLVLVKYEREKAVLWASLIGMVGSLLGVFVSVATGFRWWTKADQTSTIILVAGLGILVICFCCLHPATTKSAKEASQSLAVRRPGRDA
jgi:H+/Cl- antiporter ClcA